MRRCGRRAEPCSPTTRSRAPSSRAPTPAGCASRTSSASHATDGAPIGIRERATPWRSSLRFPASKRFRAPHEGIRTPAHASPASTPPSGSVSRRRSPASRRPRPSARRTPGAGRAHAHRSTRDRSVQERSTICPSSASRPSRGIPRGSIRTPRRRSPGACPAPLCATSRSSTGSTDATPAMPRSMPRSAGRAAPTTRRRSRLGCGRRARPDPDRLVRALTLARRLAAAAPTRVRSGALATSAWLSWALGRSSHAAIYVERALRIDRSHGLAGIVASFIEANHLPDWAFRPSPVT